MRARILLAGCAAALALGGCGADQPSDQQVTATGAPLPAMPEWAAPLMGRAATEAFPEVGSCIGHLDAVESRHAGERPGATLGGWAWNPQAARPVERVIVTDRRGRIVGAGEGGRERPDVPAAMPEVVSPQVGWRAVVQGEGGVRAYGIQGGNAICRLEGERVI